VARVRNRIIAGQLLRVAPLRLWRVQAANNLAGFHNDFVAVFLQLREVYGIHGRSDLLQKHSVFPFELIEAFDRHASSMNEDRKAILSRFGRPGFP
jgi:hypothetical protein